MSAKAAAPARNPGPPACVRDFIKLKSSPCGTAQNLRACHGIVLTNPGRKDERIDAPEGGHERPHLPSDPVDEQVDRLPGMGIRCRQRSKLAHVRRDARDAEQPTLRVEKALRLLRRWSAAVRKHENPHAHRAGDP